LRLAKTLGKGEVVGSIPTGSTSFFKYLKARFSNYIKTYPRNVPATACRPARKPD
jgi:hypothetical protein